MFRQYRQKSSYRTSLVLIKRKKNTPKTHDLFLVDVSWTVGGGEGGGAGLAVPGNVAVLGGAADGQGVDAVGVAITVTAVLLPAAVSRGPHEDWPQTATTLREEKKKCCHCDDVDHRTSELILLDDHVIPEGDTLSQWTVN